MNDEAALPGRAAAPTKVRALRQWVAIQGDIRRVAVAARVAPHERMHGADARPQARRVRVARVNFVEGVAVVPNKGGRM